MRPAIRSAITGLAFLTACGGESITDPRPILGTYTLQTVNGETLPRLLDAGAGSRTEITGGRISLGPEGMVHQEMDVRTTSAGVPPSAGTLHRFGTFVRRGSRVAVGWNGGGSDTITLSESTLMQRADGLTLVYRR